MTRQQAAGPAQAEGRQLAFDQYVLDLDRGCLTLQGIEVALRPKTFGLLCFLVENPGRLLSKDDLSAAVWPNFAITDDVLVQSIGDLRRALGSDGPRLIKTVPRRGYRFEAEVSILPPASEAAADDQLTVASPNVHTAVSIDSPSRDADRDKIVASAAAAGATGAPTTRQFNTASWRQFLEFTETMIARLGALTFRQTTLAGVVALAALLAVLSYWSRPGSQGLPASNPAITSARNPTVAPASRPSIAILPFSNQGDDPARDYFADGVTQDIINALGRYSGLTVLSWNAVLPFKGKPASPAELSGKLGARYHVEGSVRRAGDRIRVATQLVDADSRVIWSARLDEALADLFAVQDRITTQIAGALAIRLTDIEHQRVLGKPTSSLEAHDFVLRARPALQRPDRGNLAEARSLLRQAIQLDPNYAAPYAALAETYDIDVTMGWAEAPDTHLRRAEEMARKALSLNPAEVRARIILARTHLLYQRYGEAQAEIDRAIAINPNDARGLAGRVTILMWMGQADAAVEAIELAQRIDPEPHAIDRFAFTLAYYLKRRYEAAVEQANLNLSKTQDAHFVRVVMAAALGQLGRTDEALQAAHTARRMDPTFDANAIGTKFLRPEDLEHLREGLRKAGFAIDTGPAKAGRAD